MNAVRCQLRACPPAPGALCSARASAEAELSLKLDLTHTLQSHKNIACHVDFAEAFC